MANESGYCDSNEKDEIVHKIKKESKKDASKLIVGDEADKELSEWGQVICAELKKSNIWVLMQGEIEDYFGMSSSSKSQYVPVGQTIRSGKGEVPDEIEKILTWLFE